jgi:hypothetical protein
MSRFIPANATDSSDGVKWQQARSALIIATVEICNLRELLGGALSPPEIG